MTQINVQIRTKTDAKTVAEKAIKEMGGNHDFVIIDQKTIEKPFGWVFFYDTKKSIETGDRNFKVPGAGPVIVERESGKTKFVSTSLPSKTAIQIFEDQWQKDNLRDAASD